MSTTQTALRYKGTSKAGDLYMSFELGDKSWKLSVGDGSSVSRFTVVAGDKAGVADCIVRAGKRFKTPSAARVHSCYEAGRDGWWLHRWLNELGVDNIVVDAASIEVNRRARRAKTTPTSYRRCWCAIIAESGCGRCCASPLRSRRTSDASIASSSA
jgi:transposase